MRNDRSRDPRAEQALGHGSLLLSEVNEDIREIRHSPTPKPEFDQDFVDEISEVTRTAIEKGIARAKIPTIPDSDPSGLSMRGPAGIHISAKGRAVAVVVAILAFFVAVLVILLRRG